MRRSQPREEGMINETTAETFREIVTGRRRGPFPAIARFGLSLAELPYRFVVTQRNRRYDEGRCEIQRVPVPVVSVGNLTLGGTGKTPMVAWLASWFREDHVRVAIVSRGYGAGHEATNDEARELESRLPDVPHIQHPDRVKAARIAIEELGSQLILLDDGFQHRRLARDLDLVLIDATEPFGGGRVFPRGLLREPLDGLRRANAVVLTRSHLVSEDRRADSADGPSTRTAGSLDPSLSSSLGIVDGQRTARVAEGPRGRTGWPRFAGSAIPWPSRQHSCNRAGRSCISERSRTTIDSRERMSSRSPGN